MVNSRRLGENSRGCLLGAPGALSGALVFLQTYQHNYSITDNYDANQKELLKLMTERVK